MKIKIGTSQFSCIKDNVKENMNKSLDLASKAASQKVNVFLLQELFQTQYFCSTQNSKFFDLAITGANRLCSLVTSLYLFWLFIRVGSIICCSNSSK